MSQISREHLVEGFIGELKGYIPLIREDLTALKSDISEDQNLEQIYRLFHNIKGASAQLGLDGLSDTARIIEDLLESLLEGHERVNADTVAFIDQTAEELYSHCLVSIKDEESALKLLIKTICGLRNLSGDLIDENDESIKHDLLRLKNGESIIVQTETAEENSTAYVKKCLALLNTVRDISRNGGSSSRVSLLFEKLLKVLSAISFQENVSENKDTTRCTDALYDLIDWFMLHDRGIDPDIVDLLQDYFHFVELLIENPELSGAGKVDHVIETMGQVKILSDPAAAVQEDNEAWEVPQDLLLHEDAFVTVDEVLDSGQPLMEDSDDNESDFEDEEDLHEIFLAECEEHLLVIGRSLVSLEQLVQGQCEVNGEIEQLLGSMRRAVHTLKGAAGMTGFMELSSFAHQGEDLLDALCDTAGGISSGAVSILADIVEILEIMSRQQDGVSPARIEETKRKIDDFITERGVQYEEDGFSGDETLVTDSVLADPSDLMDDFVDILEDDTDERESEEQLLEDIDEDGDLHDIFLAECEEHLLVIGRSLGVLEQQVTKPQKLTGVVEQNLAEMRRAIHTLKGAAGMTGFMELSSFSHQSEDLLDLLFESDGEVTPEDISVLADAVAVIELMSLHPDTVDERRLVSVNESIQRALMSHTTDHREGDDGSGDLLDEQLLEHAGEQEEATIVDSPDVQLLPGDAAGVRVRLESLDELVSLESELIVGRSTMEQGLDELFQTITELNTAKERLRRISNELETGFEVESLYGFGSESSADDSGRQTGQRDSEFADFDPIELDRYSQLSLIIRSLNEISVDVGSIHAEMSGVSSELRGHMARQQLLMGVMQDKLMRVRMTPMSSISRSFFRTVRGAADRLGKQVRLLIEGEDVYLDRYIWTRINDPIMHILRNAVDHGVESVEDRLGKGKPRQATIKITASQKGSHVILTIADDGAGIDFGAIKKRLVQDDLVEDVAKLADNDLLEYLFVPGFSTRGQVSQISGRGVGLDVVRQNIQELRGSVRVRPNTGGGTEFELRIPVTLALNRAIIVNLGKEKFAIPLHDVLEIRKVSPSDIADGKKATIRIGDNVLTFHDLSSLIGLRQGAMKELLSLDNIIVLVVPGERENEVVSVDAIIEQQEIIVKDLGSHLKFVHGISGATIMGDGSLVPILNIAELIMSESTVLVSKHQQGAIEKREEPLNIMIVDDSVSVRQSVSRLIKSNGWKSSLATDGVDAVEKIEKIMPDLIVLDIEMPRMNGFEFMGVLKSSDQYKDIPVIMLTSRISEKHRVKAEELGVNHYLSKPYQEDEFIGLIRETTGR